jgi:hypothetical protein
VAQAIEAGLARFAERGVGVETCLFGLDGSDDILAVVAAALGANAWECVVVGGGVRTGDDQVELFEQVINPKPPLRSTARRVTPLTPPLAGSRFRARPREE